MRRKIGYLLTAITVLTLIAGCQAADTPEAPTDTPPSDATPTPTTEASVTPTPSGPASCQLAPLEFEEEPRIPPITEDDHVHGPEDASITYIEYADFQCPACSQLADLRETLQEQYGDDIRFVYRHLPLISIHDKAVITAEAAEAAAAQGKFWEMHDLLYARQSEWHQLSEEEMQDELISYAEELDLDVDQFEQELTEHVYRDEIMQQYEEYQEYGRMATPTYVVNNVFYPWNPNPILIDAFIQMLRNPIEQYEELPPQVIDEANQYQATIQTNKGDIVVELFDNENPINTNSFTFLAQDGWYDDLPFFYVDPEGVAQSGDPYGVGLGLPYTGYYCEKETSDELNYEEAGMVGLYANQSGFNSSQFFITYVPIPEITGQYTIIGRVIEGMDVLQDLQPITQADDIANADVIETITIEEMDS